MLSRNTGFLALCTSLLLFGMYLNAGLLTPRRRLDAARRAQGGVAAGASPANLTATPFHVLLLSSVGRSGSTFLGELLSQRPRTVFMFEPERSSSRILNIYPRSYSHLARGSQQVPHRRDSSCQPGPHPADARVQFQRGME
ncbi:uncharacterized protein LOC119587588 [Penaeus monodon]|uniref:uncharacterized protein LOC119587588 n=1 Tax=Penaeus monodon TaxID=6687 RepID=UPI0018A7C260|nr:uncharacterized protein LOC119587588 [Penaeus monodon]